MSPNDDVREQAVWALGNIAGDSPDCRNKVLDAGAMHPLLQQLTENSKLSMLRNATWTLSNFCRGKPQPDFNLVRPALPTLAQLIYSTDDDVLTDSCWALSYLSDVPYGKLAGSKAIALSVVRLLHLVCTLQAVVRGVSARMALWRRNCGDVKLHDRLIYAADVNGILSLQEASIVELDHRQNSLIVSTGTSIDATTRKCARSLAVFSRVAPSITGTTATWLLLSQQDVNVFHAPAAKIQALLRLKKVLFEVVPFAKQSARRAWEKKRHEQLKTYKIEQRKVAKLEVSRLFSSIPSLPKVEGEIVKLQQEILADLWAELDFVVGFQPVKLWIRCFINQSIRNSLVGKPNHVRHIIVEGGLGTGKNPAVGLIAKAIQAAGLVSTSTVTERGTLRPGQINRINMDEHGAVEVKEFDSKLSMLEKAASSSGKLALIIISGSNQDHIRSLKEKSRSLKSNWRTNTQRLTL